MAELAARTRRLHQGCRHRGLKLDSSVAKFATKKTYDTAHAVLESMKAEVESSGSARGLFTTFMTLGLLSVRLGALPEADAAARIALRVLEGLGFDRGLRLLASVLIDIAIEAGQLDEAESVLDLLRRTELPAELSTVIAGAARARLRLAQGRPAEALADFEKVRALYSAENWGLEMHDNGFLHARSGAALALLQLDEREQARGLAGQELAGARAFEAPRALGIALRVAGLTHGDDEGMALLEESVVVLRDSAAQLERGHSLCELGAALRRSGNRAAAREPLSEALDLAARCGARALAARAREELKAPGHGRVASGAQVSERSLRASCAWLASPPRAARTARSPRPCT